MTLVVTAAMLGMLGVVVVWWWLVRRRIDGARHIPDQQPVVTPQPVVDPNPMLPPTRQVRNAIVDHDHDDHLYDVYVIPPIPTTRRPRRRMRSPTPPPSSPDTKETVAVAAVTPSSTVRRRAPSRYDADARAPVAIGDDDNAAPCVVCLERAADALFQPCCHQVVCTGCWETVEAYASAAACPVCRTPVGVWRAVPPARNDAPHPSACATWGTPDEDSVATAARWL